MFQILLVAAVLFVTAVQGHDEYCRALALSGGGNKGAWEAGIVWGLTHYGNPDDFVYDVMTGVSAGTVNSVTLSFYPPGEEVQASEYLDYRWQTTTMAQSLREWPGGLAAGLFLHQGLLDYSPALETFEMVFANFTEGLQRELIVTAVNVETGLYTQFDNSQPAEQWPLSVKASSSIPFVFPPQKINDTYFMDGGTVWNTNLVSGVQKCRDFGYDDDKIIIDILNCDAYSLKQLNETSHNALENYMRAFQTHRMHKKTNDILEFKRAFPDVNFRYYFEPEEGTLTSGKDELKFDNGTTYPMQEVGRRDAQKMLGLDEGYGFKLLEDYHYSDEVKAEHLSFSDYFKKMTESFLK